MPAARRRPQTQPGTTDAIRFAIIGDYGQYGSAAESVADLVKSWVPDFITTVGDNNYANNLTSEIDGNIGEYYHQFMHPYAGSNGTGADINRFFPVLGNHDWDDPAQYFDYFTLPGNERYYTFGWGPVRFFMIDSDEREPDGVDALSDQAMWLRDQLAASTAVWNLVHLHHSPYSSADKHGSQTTLQWPFAQWGAHAVFSGHDHNYERLHRDGIVYFVNGLGGSSRRGFDRRPLKESAVRYWRNYGAMRIDADAERVTMRFIDIEKLLIDTVHLTASSSTDPPTEEPPTDPCTELSKQISRSIDHATEAIGPKSVRYAESKLLLGDSDDNIPQLTGLRFKNVQIPPGVTISEARIEFTICREEKDAITLEITGEKRADSSPFLLDQANLSTRPRTQNVLLWNDVPAWYDIGDLSWTPNLATIVQEILDAGEWSSGNAIAFFFREHNRIKNSRRCAVTVDRQPLAAPRLQISYQFPTTESPPPDLSDTFEHKLFLPLTSAGGCRQ